MPLLRSHVLPGAIKPPRERVPATQVTRGTTPPVRHRPPRPNAHRGPISLRATPHLASMRARDTSHPAPAQPAKLHAVSEPTNRQVVRLPVMMRTRDTTWVGQVPPHNDPVPSGAINQLLRNRVASPPTRHFSASVGATSQQQCFQGTYQPASNSSSCIDASPGHIAPGSGSTSQTACGVGTYQAASGQVACDDADPGYFVGTTGASSQTLCPSGSYQPASAQTSCIATDPGNYSASAGATSQTQCAAGTYQPNANCTSCIDASRGHFAAGLGSTAQTPCSPGTYQADPRQADCDDASSGHHVGVTAATSQTPPPRRLLPTPHRTDHLQSLDTGGTSSPRAGPTPNSNAVWGPSNLPRTPPRARVPLPGYHVPAPGSTSQTACGLGTYQPSTGQSSCSDASAGYYVGIMGASSQTACPPGSYQPATTSTTCIASSPGSHAAGPVATSQAQCSSGTYQPNTNASSCTSASSGFFVSGVGAISQSPCLLGTYQSSTGQTSCDDAQAGYYVDTGGASSQTPCPAGSYQANTGRTTCTATSPGHYTAIPGSTSQTQCTPGTYQGSSNSSPVMRRIRGPMPQARVQPLNSNALRVRCSNPPPPARDACDDADPGYVVTGTGQTSQTPCASGTYNPSSGGDEASDCLPASAGSFVANQGSSTQTPCGVGTFQSAAGQSSCNPASAGHFVAGTGATAQVAFAILEPTKLPLANPVARTQVRGTMSPFRVVRHSCNAMRGPSNQTPASRLVEPPTRGITLHPWARRLRRTALQGPTIRSAQAPPQWHACRRTRFYAPLGSAGQIQCAPGSFAANSGQATCTLANGGHYVTATGATTEIGCPTGTYLPSRGNDALADCIISPVGHYVSTTGQASATPCPGGTYNNNTGSTTLSDCIPVGPGQYASSGFLCPTRLPSRILCGERWWRSLHCRLSRVLCPNTEPDLSDRMFARDVCAQPRPDLMRYHSARVLQPDASGLEHPPMLERDLPTQRGPNRMLGRRSGVLRRVQG